MKELKNLEAIRELLASHPIYTYDYSDGLLINKEEHDEIIDYYINFLEKPETLYTFTEKTINFLKTLIK